MIPNTLSPVQVQYPLGHFFGILVGVLIHEYTRILMLAAIGKEFPRTSDGTKHSTSVLNSQQQYNETISIRMIHFSLKM